MTFTSTPLLLNGNPYGGLPNYNGLNAINNPAAYGSIPKAPTAASTAATSVPQAITAGTTVNSQLPGYLQDVTHLGGNISSELSGELPPDVINQIKQRAAERGVSTGTVGSPNENAAYLRALGLTSLDLEQAGQKDLNSATAALPGASVANNPNFYLNPSLQYDSDLTKAIYAAAPNPMAAALAGVSANQLGRQSGQASAGVSGSGSGSSVPWQQQIDNMWSTPSYSSPGGVASPSNAAPAAGSTGYYNGQPVSNPGGGNDALQTVNNIINKYDPSNLSYDPFNDEDVDYYDGSDF